MAVTNSDGSIILTTKVDESGINKGFASMQAGAKSVGKSFTNLASTVGKAFLAIGAAAATATIAIAKASVEAYAEYEQLVGGVETLFKDSSKKVIEYANEAYKTTGQSANEYMQNVTAFSASLLDAVGGDTDKAADIANSAMISISDNVNKMGSSAESVQMAFQGFAKQQYMLLDNLKLGYGGTKGEMERLLKDAKAITGVEYNIDNLADVYTAIGVIQEKLGIAGTTAKEASTTISGSAATMKAAWKNVLTAISGGGDLDRAINNLVDSISIYFQNIVPVVERALSGIGVLIEKVAPMLVQTVVKSVIEAIPSLLSAVYQMIIGLSKGIYEGIKALFSGGTVEVIEEQTEGIATSVENQKALTEEVENTEKALEKTLAGFDDLQILTSNASEGDAISEAIPESTTIDNFSALTTDAETSKAPSFFDTIYETLKNIKDLFLTGFWKGFADADFSKVTTSLSNIKETLGAIFSNESVQGSISNFSSTFITALGQIVGSVAQLGIALATNLFGGFNSYLSENSGFITDKIGSIFDASSRMTEAVGNTFNSFSNILSNIIGGKSGQELTGNIIGIFSNAGLTIVELATEIGADFMESLSTVITENEEGLSDTLESVVELFANLTQSIETLITHVSKEISRIYNEHISPLFKSIGKTVSQWVKTFTDAWEKNIKPVLDDFSDKFETVVNEHIIPAIDSVLNFVGKVIDIIQFLWEKWLSPIVNWLIAEASPKIGNALELVGDVFNTLLSVVGDVVSGIFDTLSGVIDYITDVFSGDWEGAWENIKSIFSTIWNTLAGVIGGVVNVIIDGLNFFIRAINQISFDVPDWVPELGGKKVGFDLPEISQWNVPKLATGAVIPPNREFLAVLGDNKKENEIVSPVSTMKQAFMEAMIEMGGNFGVGNTEVILEIDGREFGRAVVEQGNRENRRIGTRLVNI